MKGIFDFFTSILGKITGFAAWILEVIKRLFLDVWVMAYDFVCFVIEAALAVAIGALDLITVPFDPQSYYQLIPADVANMLGYIGIPQALAMIVGALLIRFVLQMIPFVRWGS